MLLNTAGGLPVHAQARNVWQKITSTKQNVTSKKAKHQILSKFVRVSKRFTKHYGKGDVSNAQRPLSDQCNLERQGYYIFVIIMQAKKFLIGHCLKQVVFQPNLKQPNLAEALTSHNLQKNTLPHLQRQNTMVSSR